MAASLRNIIVVGGSFVGGTTARELARIVPSTHRVLLTEPHSHFHHLFAFPRFAIVPGQEHKSFIPYTALFNASPNPSSHGIIQARALSVKPTYIELDREWQGSKEVPFDYVVVATGTRLSKPAAMDDDDKASSVEYLQKHQAGVKRSQSILIVGGGAVGVQMATDLKEYYPEKEVTVVQSRPQVMPSFHSALHGLIKRRFDELGIRLITGSRVIVPPGGFLNDGSTFNVQLTNGTTESTQFVILATGQTPNNQLVADLKPSRPDGKSVVNPDNGFIRVRPTMQFLDEQYSNMFAVGDIADTGAQKAARPGSAQATVVAKNIQALIEGRAAEDTFTKGPGAIHLTLGMKHNVVFRNPNTAEGQTEPSINQKDDGREDMNVEAMWERLGVSVGNPRQYHL
ncbi:FAD-dependent pyridine nucleotide-disulfide oxidoreductase [Penicillium italicum]|uniref:FAD-dependent pyridine nucleotide-disulfide oxidoreductase n=1 Tax=Penicillium italicum TaxID=40296 RepID=A0A0A2KI62_PENIT|nr:FAD-dependent pyridine nucleotide-disulfide oxidoreductase [Penicillium italicum]